MRKVKYYINDKDTNEPRKCSNSYCEKTLDTSMQLEWALQNGGIYCCMDCAIDDYMHYMGSTILTEDRYEEMDLVIGEKVKNKKSIN